MIKLREALIESEHIIYPKDWKKFHVHGKYDDPTGTGIASVRHSFMAKDSEHAKRIATSHMKRHGKAYKNYKVVKATHAPKD